MAHERVQDAHRVSGRGVENEQLSLRVLGLAGCFHFS
jgi:hypothetical protein